jgi:Ca-activated chloride channel family protein
MSGGKLGADDVVVNPSKGPTQAAGSEIVARVSASDADLRAIWLRRVQTQPADFLRAKFAAQLAQREAAVAGTP